MAKFNDGDRAMRSEIDEELTSFGGFLRCETCGHVEPLGSPGEKVSNGWPRHCDLTMRWWTDRQIDAGEVTCMACAARTIHKGRAKAFPYICACGWGLIASR